MGYSQAALSCGSGRVGGGHPRAALPHVSRDPLKLQHLSELPPAHVSSH